jgi:protein TonB
MSLSGQTFTAGTYAPMTSPDLDDRFGTAIIFSIIVHMALIFGVQFTQANPKLFERATPPLEVVLVNAKSASKPLQADVLAQANLDGGGDVDLERQAKSPLPASAEDAPASASQETANRLTALLRKTRQVLTQAKSSFSVADSSPDSADVPRPPVPPAEPSDIASRSLEMARLQAKIDAEWEAYQKRPRKMFVGARAQEFGAARYVEDWRLKVERVGNQNYPEAARRQHIYGSLILEVCLRPDGSLYRDPLGEADNPAVVKTSGARILDAAAVHIVEMSAPFAAFSPELLELMRRMGRDVFCITRTWSFTRDDQLTSQ